MTDWPAEVERLTKLLQVGDLQNLALGTDVDRLRAALQALLDYVTKHPDIALQHVAIVDAEYVLNVTLGPVA